MQEKEEKITFFNERDKSLNASGRACGGIKNIYLRKARPGKGPKFQTATVAAINRNKIIHN